MTKGKKFKQRVRARVAQTGESYSRAREVEGGSKGLLFWYYHSTEYPEEGSVFPFASRLEAETHAGEDKDEMTFAEREATEEELILIGFGRDFRSSRKTALVHQDLHDQLVGEARRMAHALRSEAGWEETWPFPWETVDGEKEITVNGRKMVTTQDALSYEEVLLLAYPGIDTARNLSVTVSYRDGRGKILTRGESARVEPKMVFNAYDTSNA